MKSVVTKIKIPSTSKISTQLTGAYFCDSYKLSIPNTERSALDLYLGIASKTPAWVNRLMTLRNRVVSFLGLKNVGHIDDIDFAKPASKYSVGDRVGIFSILSLSKQEVILGDSDKHLDVKLSVYKLEESENSAIVISTVVHIHNRLGKIYMLFVEPIHKLISPTMIRLAQVE